MKRINSGLFCLVWVLALLAMFLVPASASSQPKLVDDANLLTQEQAASLSATLEEISTRQGYDVVVVTVNSLDGKSAMAYADDYFDYNGYGPDGILLLLGMEDRVWWFSTKGEAIAIFTDSVIESMGNHIVPSLSSGDYYQAFAEYADMCDRRISDYVLNPDSRSITFEEESTPNIPMRVVVSLLVGSLLACIPMLILKKQVRMVAEKQQAADYMCRDSLQLQVSNDVFLRRNVVRTARPKQEDRGGGGSSTHISSSGSTHGGGGGHF